MVSGPPPATCTVRARVSASGSAHADAGTETIRFDASWGTGPSGLPGPAEQLAAAFAACLLKNLNRAGQFLSFRYERAEVDVMRRYGTVCNNLAACDVHGPVIAARLAQPPPPPRPEKGSGRRRPATAAAVPARWLPVPRALASQGRLLIALYQAGTACQRAVLSTADSASSAAGTRA